MATRMQQRRGTALQWSTANPILNAGEIGWESDTNQFKIGDGTNHWNDLSYFLDETAINTSLGDYVETATLGQPDGVATLDSNGKLESAQLPDVAQVTVHAVADQAARLALSVQVGDIAIQADNGQTYVLASEPASTNGNWSAITVSDVASLTGNNTFSGDNLFTGTVSLSNDLTVEGDLTVNGTTTTISATELVLKDNLIYVNEPEAFNVGNAVGDGTNVTYTIGEHSLTTSMVVSVVGIDPAGLNTDGYAEIVSVTSTTVTVANTNTATYVSGGSLFATFAVAPDLGFAGAYVDETSYSHAGIVRDGTDGVFKFFDSYEPEPSLTIDFTQATLAGIAVSSASIGDVVNSEIQHLTGVSSNIQTQLNDKASSTDLQSHESATTGVHGISDTANLAYLADISSHNSDTTGVHGISDTSDLLYTVDLTNHESDTTTHGVAGNIVGTSDAQTLTNKTIALGSNLVSGTIAEFNSAVSDADLATIAGTESLSNKTISYIDNTITVQVANVSDLTASAAELNTLDGITASTAELNILDGVTASAAEINVLDGITASTTELNYVDGVTSAIQTQLDGKLDESGGTLTGFLTLHADPTQALHAVTKQYVDTVAEGLHVHASVVALADSNISLPTAPASVDGVTLSVNDRILLIGQTAKAENGIYVVINGDLARAADYNTAAEIDAGDFVFVSGGTIYGNTGWVQENAVTTLGTDPIEFSQFSGVGTVTAGTNVSVTGNEVSVINNPTFSGLVTASSGVAFSDGTQTKQGVPSITEITQKNASYTLSSLAERDTIIEIGSGSATTLSIPTDATLNYPVGTTIDIIQTGTGQVTIAAVTPATTTVNGTPGLKLRAQWSSATLLKRAANTWLVYGDLAQ